MLSDGYGIGWKRVVHIVVVGWVIALSLAAAPAFPHLTGLTVIPTAETIGPGQYEVELEHDQAVADLGTAQLLNTVVGIGDRFEWGLDYDIGGDGATMVLGSAKYVLASGNQGRSAASSGSSNAGAHIKPSPFVVALQDFGLCRAHLGTMRIEAKSRWLGGLDTALGDRWTFAADYTSGTENFSSVGANCEFSDRLSVLVGVLFPNSGGGSVFTVHLTFGGTYLGWPLGGR